MNPNSYKLFLDAVHSTHIIRERKNDLFTFGNTKLPYTLVADSAINKGSSIVRTGEVVVEKPQIVIANGDNSVFEGFDLEDDSIDLNQVRFALMSRGISFPQMNYKNSTNHLEVLNDKSKVIIDRMMNDFEDENDSRSALIQCREDLWGLSLFHYVLGQVIKSSSSNIKEYMERFNL
ncbi:MAG: hypothetical protein COA79_05030 [Planctomycetota bacterium]|nr:MAG: hypothetical protein COA79_05030 [Planctomycetota bacterium]